MSLKLKMIVLSAAACLWSAQGFAAPQEETFTIPEEGAEYLDGKKLSKLMDRSDPKAATNIGWLYARGQGGVQQDFKEAMLWWKHAARSGYTPAMNNVGLLYANGHGVSRDYEEAFKWWMRAAERGNAWAMNAVGDLYENGHGVPQSYENALAWSQEAAREGDALAHWNIGNLSEQGQGTAVSYEEAMRWYQIGAARGHALSMHSVGRLVHRGLGTKADPVEAYAWYAVAALRFTEEDTEEAAENSRLLQEVAGLLNDEQRTRGDARTAELDRKFARPEKGRAAQGSDA
ncbi:MAG: tetratricopeptide repeat protein [Betaproteobacteria bacterium]